MTREWPRRWCIAIVYTVVMFGRIAGGAPALAATPDAVEVHANIGHSQFVTSVAVSPTSDRLLSGSADKTVKLWDVLHDRLIRTFFGATDQVEAVAFSPDGKNVEAVSLDKSIRVWDAATGQDVRVIKSGRSITQPVFAPDGRFVAANTSAEGNLDARISVWDVPAGRLVRDIPQDGHRWRQALAISPDGGSLLVDVNDATIEVWDTRTGQRVTRMKGYSLGEPENGVFSPEVTSGEFSSDGKTVLTTSKDKTIKLWNVASGQLVRTFEGHTGEVKGAKFTRDGARIVSGSEDKTVIVWDVATAHILKRFRIGNALLAYFAVFPSGGAVVSPAGEKTPALWLTDTGAPVRLFGSIDSELYATSVSPDGRKVAVGDQLNRVLIWNAVGGRLEQVLTGHASGVSSVAWLPDSRRVLSGSHDGTVRLWDSETGSLVRKMEGEPFPGDPAVPGFSVALSPDGTRALAGGRKLQLWDVESGRMIHEFDSGIRRLVNSVATSKDGLVGFSLAGGKKIRFWDLAGNKLLREFNVADNVAVYATLSPNQEMLTSGIDGVLRLWGATRGNLLRSFDGHAAQLVAGFAFSRDGTQLLSGGYDGTVQLWDVPSGRIVRTFDIQAAVSSVAFSPDGSRVLAGGTDGGLRIFDRATGALLTTSLVTFKGDWVTVTPEGFFDSSVGGAKALTVVHGLDTFSVNQFYQQLYRPDLVREKLAGDPKGLVKAAATKMNLSIAVESGRPPDVTVSAPGEAAGKGVKVDVDIADRGGGIGNVEWRVNGVTKGVGTRGIGDAAAGDRQGVVHLSRTFDLLPGANTVEVVAYNGANLVASLPGSVAVAVKNDATPEAAGRLFVVAVGVNDYSDSRLHLAYAVPDAQAIVANLERAKGNLYQDVVPQLILDGKVTAARLGQVFGDLAAQVRPQDTFVLFMAGHGKTLDGHYYFIPSDFRYVDPASVEQGGIGQGQLQSWLAKIPAARSVLLFDTCESGTMTGSGITQQALEVLMASAVGKITQATGRTVIAASSENAPALEGYHGHGVLTYSVLRAISEANTDREGRIEVTGLISYVDRMVRQVSLTAFNQEQRPQTSFVGSDFPLVVREGTLPSGPAVADVATGGKPTHVVLTSTPVFADAGGHGPGLEILGPGTLVSVVRSENGWALVMRNGSRLGFVNETALAATQ